MNSRSLPRFAVIGKWRFSIEIAHPKDVSDLEDAYGLMYPAEQRIVIRAGLPNKLFLNTLCHELTHAVNWVYGVTDESDEEAFTERHTDGYLQFRLDNKRLDNWITRAVNEIRTETIK